MGRSLEIGEVLQTLCEEVQQGARLRQRLRGCSGDEVDGYVVHGRRGPAGRASSASASRRARGSGGRAVQAGRTLVTQRYQEEGYRAARGDAALDEIKACVAAPLRWDGAHPGIRLGRLHSPARDHHQRRRAVEGSPSSAGMACANAERHAEVREAAEIDGLTGCLNRDALAAPPARADRRGGRERAPALGGDPRPRRLQVDQRRLRPSERRRRAEERRCAPCARASRPATWSPATAATSSR